MKKERKQLIISEIKYWRQNKLLPAHYCDFLIALYAQGEEEESDVKVSDSVLIKEKNKQKRIIILLSLLTAGLSMSLFFFIDYPAITFGLTVISFFLLLLFAGRTHATNPKLNSVLYILCAFMLLAISLKLWMLVFEEDSLVLIGILLVNCMIWIFAGRMLKLLYFTISGMVGILLIVISIFTQI